MTVLCLVEHDDSGPIDASLRALTFGRTIGSDGDLVALVVGQPSAQTVEALSAHGARCVLVVAAEAVGGYSPMAWARVLAEVSAARSVSAVVAASTDRGAEVLAHLGAIERLPMAANCLAAEDGGAGRWRLTRQRWGGSLIEDAVLEAATVLLTVATDAVSPTEAPGSLPATVEQLSPLLAEGDLAVCAAESREEAGGVSLANARVVVSGGRGVGGVEGFEVVDELAALLGGAVGVSRVVTSLGWRPHSQQVGQTGTRVTPDLYLACGISGAIQHLAGCQSAKTMVAINTDPEAPIMSRADYAVIGDLAQVLPALVEALRARAGR
jgi:electron transfer flavoprotein alpha subunit